MIFSYGLLHLDTPVLGNYQKLTYVNSVWTSWYHLGDVPREITDRDWWWERERERERESRESICCQWWWWWWLYIDLCIDASTHFSMLASSLTSFFSWHKISSINVHQYHFCLLVYFCLSSSLFHFKNILHVFILLTRFLLQKVFLFFWGTLFLFFPFISACLMISASNIPQVLVIFLLSKHSDSFLIWYFYFFHCFSFPTFYLQNDIIFCAKFHSYILAVYFYSLHQGFLFF